MQTLQPDRPNQQKRVSILSGNLRTITIVLGVIFALAGLIFWINGINNDNEHIDKIMGAIFTFLLLVCAILTIPFLSSPEDMQTSASAPIPPIQIINNNTISPNQVNTGQPVVPTTQTSNNSNKKEQIENSQNSLGIQPQPLLVDTSNVNPPKASGPGTSQSNLSNKFAGYPSPVGKRNVLDATFFGELVRTLEGIPAISSFQGRNSLLIGLPRNVITSLNRDSNSDTNDLENILTQLDGLGPLETGEQPLVIFIQNALRRAEGLSSSKSLNTILDELKHRYGLS